MKKSYVKPCSTCVIMAVEQAMLAESKKGLRVTNENLERVDPTIIGSSTPSTPSTPSAGGNAKENPFQYDEE